MLLDVQNEFSTKQVVTENAASTQNISFVGKRVLSARPGVEVMLHISAKSGTNPTLQAKLVGGNNADLSTGKVTLSDTGTLASPGPGFVRMAIPVHAPMQYYWMEYVVGGTNPSFTVTAGLCNSKQTAGAATGPASNL